MGIVLEKKIVIGILPMLFLTGTLALTFSIQTVKSDWTGTVYIRADGSIDPSNAPIQRNGNFYTLTDNIASDGDGIVVQRSNIRINGNGNQLIGSGEKFPITWSAGFNLTNVYNVTIENTQVSSFQCGIYLRLISQSFVWNSNIKSNVYRGIYLKNSSDITICNNNIVDNDYEGIMLEGSSKNNIVANNITYTLPNHSYGITVRDSSNFNIIVNNDISLSNYNGILIAGSSNNTVAGNNIRTNKRSGVSLVYSLNNKFYHNNFMDNTLQADTFSSYNNIWDDGYPSGGNYWSDYNGTDLHWISDQNETVSDGIGDTAYAIGENNVDRYPLMAPFNTFEAGVWNETAYFVDVISNSTVSNFHFNPDEGPFLRFNVTCDDGTAGFCRVTIPKDLLWADNGWTITVGNQTITNYTTIPNENFTYLYFTYNHSTQTVTIQGTGVIPEFPSSILPLGFLMLVTIPLIFTKKRYRKAKT